MPNYWLDTRMTTDADGLPVPDFKQQAWSGYATIATDPGTRWFGLVCAPQASWDKWTQIGAITTYTSLEAAVERGVALGATERAVRAAALLCDAE